MKIKMSRVKGERKVSVVCDEFKLTYSKGYGIIELPDKSIKDNTIIDYNLNRLLGYTNYKEKNDLERMLSKFMGE